MTETQDNTGLQAKLLIQDAALKYTSHYLDSITVTGVEQVNSLFAAKDTVRKALEAPLEIDPTAFPLRLHQIKEMIEHFWTNENLTMIDYYELFRKIDVIARGDQAIQNMEGTKSNA